MSDAGRPSVRRVIIEVLQRLVPHPPFRIEPLDEDPDEYATNASLTWIQIHEPELREMKPTGNGVDLSLAACAQHAK